jgi:hypothetical protein
MKVIRWAAIAGLLLRTALTSADAQSVRGTTSGVDRVLSPTVVATWISHQDESGTSQLDLLVLWRGAPGWFMQGEGGGAGGGVGSLGANGASVFTSRIRYGYVDVALVFDSLARNVQVNGREIALGDANVILLDGVDAALGPQVFGTHRVEPTIPEGERRIEMVLRRSTELLDYLRCDVRLPDPNAQEQMEFLCAQVLGKCEVRLTNAVLQRMLEASCLP